MNFQYREPRIKLLYIDITKQLKTIKKAFKVCQSLKNDRLVFSF